MEDKIILEGIFDKGYGFIAKSIMQNNTISLQAKGVYGYICSYCGKGNDAFPSREKMCHDLHISNDSLGKYLTELKENKLVRVNQCKDKNGKFMHNTYTINLQLPHPNLTDTENTVSEKTVYGKLDTNNNNINNNIYSANDVAPDKPVPEKDTKTEDFEKLWNIYPSKKGKAKAFSSYCNWLKGKKYMNKAIKLTNAQMWYAIKKYVKECEDSKRFFQNGSTFFNNTIIEYVKFDD